MKRRAWHYATSYGPGRDGPDMCLWCSAEIFSAWNLCPCCRSRLVRIRRRLWLMFIHPVLRLRHHLSSEGWDD